MRSRVARRGLTESRESARNCRLYSASWNADRVSNLPLKIAKNLSLFAAGNYSKISGIKMPLWKLRRPSVAEWKRLTKFFVEDFVISSLTS